MIKRSKIHEQYTTISHTPLLDNNLTLSARGLYVYLRTLPDGETSPGHIQKSLNLTEDMVMSLMDELFDNGYITSDDGVLTFNDEGGRNE